MCGRTVCSLAPDQLCYACQRLFGEKNFSIINALWRDHPQLIDGASNSRSFIPNYNMTPSQFSPVLVSAEQSNLWKPMDNLEPCPENSRILMPMHWGFVPHYHKKSLADLSHRPPVNARKDTLELKSGPGGMFAYAVDKRQRCVVVVDGFYEWQGQSRPKQPHFFHLPQNQSISMSNPERENVDQNGMWAGRRMLMLAGIFDRCLLAGEERSLFSYAIVTVPASQWFKSIHSRMPAILSTESAVSEWLDPSLCSSDVFHHLSPLTTRLESFAVDRKFVNNPSCRNDSCLTAVFDLLPIESPAQKRTKRKFGTPPRKTLLAYFPLSKNVKNAST